MSTIGGNLMFSNEGIISNPKGNGGFGDNKDKRKDNLNNRTNQAQGRNRKKNFNKSSTQTRDGGKNKPQGGNRPNRRKQNEPSNNTPSNESDYDDILPEARVIPKMNMNMQRYSKKDIGIAGPLVRDPNSLGFKPKKIQPREIPKYLQIQERIITPISFKQHTWDKENQAKMNQMEAQNSGNDYQGLYEEFQKMREVERKKMEDLGLVDAENTRKDLNDAIAFQGTCLDMCPTFERVRRALENNVKKFEKDPVTNKITKEKAVKAFSRPAAGQPPPLLSEVRPPHILKNTLDYLVQNIVPLLPDAHSFIWDRTRSIRQDFTYQNYYGPEAIDCNERIVRIHLISLHIMAGNDVEYSQQQELEQFNKALQTLIEIYQDVRNRGGKCPNEPEFRAYYLLSHLRESEVEREIQNLPDDILEDEQVQLAIKFRNLASQNNIVERGFKNSNGSLNLFVEFFRLTYKDTTPFLIACLLETHFNKIRFYAIKAMTRGYHSKGKAYNGEILRTMLGFDDVSQLLKFVQYYDIDVIDERGVFSVDLVNREKLQTQYKINSVSQKPKLAQAFSKQIDKKITKSLSEFINCGKPNDNLNLKRAQDAKVFESKRNAFTNAQQNSEPTEVKAGSFADFMSKSSAGGFSSSALAFQSSKPEFSGSTSSFTTRPPPAKKEESPAAVHVSLPKVEESTFSSQKKDTGFSFNPKPQPVIPQPAAPKLDFGKTSTLQTEPSIVAKDKEPKVQFDFGVPPAAKEVERVAPSIVTPALKFEATKAEAAPPVAIRSNKMLNESKHFATASKQVTDSIISETIDGELEKLLPKIIRHLNQSKARSRVIESLGKDLYEAFLNEIIFKTALVAKAQAYYEKKMKIKYIKKIKQVGDKMKAKQIIKQKRQNELNEIKFNNTNSLKRQVSNSSFTSSSKRRHVWDDTSISEIVDRRTEIEKLWEPLNLNKLIDNMSSNFKLGIEVDRLDLKALVLVENFKLNYSKWLVNKLKLKPNTQTQVYDNVLQNDKITLNIQSLPDRNKLTKEFFENTSIVLFECGLLEPSSKFANVEEKLDRDGLILKKVMDLIHKYGDYKVQLLVLYWDVSGSNLTSEQIQARLGLSSTRSSIICNLVMCDMSQSNINDILNQGFVSLGNTFKGELTRKGKKKKQIHVFKNPPQETTINDDKFKANEIKLLKKAQMDKKYSYLNAHSLVNQLLHNQLLLNHLLLNQLILNRSMASNRLFANNSGISTSTILEAGHNPADTTNMSILGQFGNGIIEESTPFNSPKKFAKPRDVSKVTKKASKGLPQSLQLLIDLAAKVKSKYKS